VQHIVALSRSAVVVRHWFEIDLDDAAAGGTWSQPAGAGRGGVVAQRMA
jgi:hypothetical protein